MCDALSGGSGKTDWVLQSIREEAHTQGAGSESISSLGAGGCPQRMIHRDKLVLVFPLGLRSTVSDQAGVSTGRQPALGHSGETPGGSGMYQALGGPCQAPQGPGQAGGSFSRQGEVGTTTSSPPSTEKSAAPEAQAAASSSCRVCLTPPPKPRAPASVSPLRLRT